MWCAGETGQTQAQRGMQWRWYLKAAADVKRQNKHTCIPFTGKARWAKKQLQCKSHHERQHVEWMHKYSTHVHTQSSFEWGAATHGNMTMRAWIQPYVTEDLSWGWLQVQVMVWIKCNTPNVRTRNNTTPPSDERFEVRQGADSRGAKGDEKALPSSCTSYKSLHREVAGCPEYTVQDTMSRNEWELFQ